MTRGHVEGGIIPDVDIPKLNAMGITGIFLPGTPMLGNHQLHREEGAGAGRDGLGLLRSITSLRFLSPFSSIPSRLARTPFSTLTPQRGRWYQGTAARFREVVMRVDDEASVPFRRDWLHRVVNHVQALAGGFAGDSDVENLERALENLPQATTKLEAIILRGLKAEATDARNQLALHLWPHARFALQARDLLETRYGEAWTVARLAREAGCNRTILEEAFKRVTHMTVHQFLVQRRVAAARELLVRTAEGLKTIADRVGFGEATFIRQFRRTMGTSPDEYRRHFQRQVTRASRQDIRARRS